MEEGTTATLVSPLDHIIERPRLISLLEESGARIILLCAPAGYGKTTLARQWSARQTGPVAWYRTTRASGDVAALAVGLDNLLSTVMAPQNDEERRVASIAAVPGSPEALARALAATYSNCTGGLLVLDEWESAATAAADEFMAVVIDELPLLQILVASRTRPQWVAPRLAVYGDAFAVGLEQLAMTDEEARAVLATNKLQTTTPPLLNAARGWPAVIGLAARRPSSNPPPDAQPEALYEFLARDLLGSVATEVQRALTLLAISGTRDAATAECLFGDQTQSILDQAKQYGLIRSESASLFSLHPLLRDLLISRIPMPGGIEAAALARSLRPLIDNCRWDEALASAEVLLDEAFVSAAMERALPSLLHTGRVDTLRRWVTAGRSLRSSLALVDYADGELALREGDFERAAVLGDIASRSLSGDQAAKAHLLVSVAANLSDRFDLARRHLSAATRLASSSGTREEAAWRALVQALDDEAENAAWLLDQFASRRAPDRSHVIRAAHARMRVCLLEGDLSSGLSEAEVALALISSTDHPMACSAFLNVYSCALATAGRYAEALRAADRMLAIATKSGLEFVRQHALVAQIRALIGLRRVGPAQRSLDELDRRQATHSVPDIAANRAIEKGRLYITLGDLDRAEAALSELFDPRLYCGARGELLALSALVHAAKGNFTAALEHAQEATLVSRAVQVRGVVSASTCIAQLSDWPAEHEEVPPLDAVFACGAGDPIVLACRASTAFAQRAASVGRHRDTLIALLRASHDAAIARRVGLAIPRPTRQSEKLSPRELEIHELMAEGLTNPEISKLLFIAESTTKVHVRHILEKLGVRSRVEAARVWEDSREPGSR